MTPVLGKPRTVPAAPSAPALPRPRMTWPRPIWTLIVLGRFLRGYLYFLRTRRTRPATYVDMRRLFKLTNGWSNDVLGVLDRIRHPRRRFANAQGVLGSLGRNDVRRLAQQINRDGLARLDTRLDAGVRTRLITLAREAPCHVYPRPTRGSDVTTYDERRWVGTRYVVDRQTLHEHPDIQTLATDLSILSVVQAYLPAQPVFIGACMWWSTAFSRQACRESAQMFHFDMSQIRFVKLFCYLTDVDERSGAHEFVVGSHRRLPRHLRDDRRFRDDEIIEAYGADHIATLAGPTGSMFFEDTRGIHKGLPLQSGHRLIFELLYATSTFGEPLATIALNDRFSPHFRAMARRYPHIYQQFREPAS